ncbi:MAG TPA: sigma-70 family RNA polymerase sigma factor [Solirubrobacteraceae bacterium]
MAAVRAGDDHAFEQLYHRYQRRIGAYIYGMVHDHGRAEDITQDVFMSALRRMRATETPIAFKPWVYEIAKNACIDAFRRSKRSEEISYDADDGSERLHLVSKGPTPEAAVDTRMSLDHLRGAFGGLSDAHHQILVMRELEGLSYRQIGERLGMSRPSVESTLFRARRRLSEEYEELVSGERCRRIQAIITGASDGRVGARDERKMARHVSYCQPCRRAAFAAGFDADALTPKRTVREKIAALLPLPAFLKRRIAGHGAEESAATSAGGHGATLAQLSTAAATYADPVMHWGKAVAKAAAVAAAVVGAGVAAHDTGLIGATPRDERPAAISSPTTPSRDAAGSLTTRPAANATSTGAGSSPSSSKSSSGGSSSGSGSSGGAGSSSGSQSPSTPLGSDPVSGATSQLPSGTKDNPVTKTVKHLTNPDLGGVSVKAPEVPKVEVPKLPDPPPSVPDPGGVVSGATGAVNDATGAVSGAVDDTTGTVTGAVDDTTGTVTGTVDGTVGTVTGSGGILGGG